MAKCPDCYGSGDPDDAACSRVYKNKNNVSPGQLQAVDAPEIEYKKLYKLATSYEARHPVRPMSGIHQAGENGEKWLESRATGGLKAHGGMTRIRVASRTK
ncbi:hypothetical protein IOC61_17450 [Halomonas sp. KAO]|uniref:hypothetical protein n=1 Tax=unclassified Halomonas TaxID=2609666 RepID=UPI00189DCAAE|nr:MULTISPECIES: hypothetical protein [unclassified Halomonas]MBF7055086.1 hypothetical protein [Halomonas sp. KAO]MDT0502547.1 hypothetical protein [Halomonas sp. PAR7]MDT0512980.1 hypothetical protein [Halomonas sp. LES1]MDT0591195.1 hypothetical protein [Halomonas sp. PAR8]